MSILFESFQLGDINLNNRIIMAPMTRSRANVDGIPSELAATYYGQRASAGLIITEATAISKQGSGYVNIPGIYSNAQITSWQKITDAIHQKGGKVFIQQFHTGRVNHSSLHGLQPVAPSAIRLDGKVMNSSYQPVDYETPKELSLAEIQDIINQFKTAATNAKKAGFDGIEIHGANGYLIDQFIRDGANQRTDQYGGSLENRTNFLFEVLHAAIEIWGAKKVGLRLSPYSSFNGMSDSDPIKTFTYIANKLNDLPLSYLHLLEPVTNQNAQQDPKHPRMTPMLHKAYLGTLIANGGLTKDTATALIENCEADLIAFGNRFIANPDLVERLKNNFPLAEADTTTFYGGNEHGYTDYQAYTPLKKA